MGHKLTEIVVLQRADIRKGKATHFTALANGQPPINGPIWMDFHRIIIDWAAAKLFAVPLLLGPEYVPYMNGSLATCRISRSGSNDPSGTVINVSEMVKRALKKSSDSTCKRLDAVS